MKQSSAAAGYFNNLQKNKEHRSVSGVRKLWQEHKKGIIKYRLMFTVFILTVYLAGRSIPLYGVDVSGYYGSGINAQTLLFQSIGGDRNHYSIFALGISPYMISSIYVHIIASVYNTGRKSKIPEKKLNRLSVIFAFILAVVQAAMNLKNLNFTVTGDELDTAMFIAFIEMVTGAGLIIRLTDSNKKYGFGGQTVIIFTNIVESIMALIKNSSPEYLVLPLLISFVVLIIVIAMENAEKRIPLQRISIHNVYADKNYLSLKLNPMGVMPLMFSTAAFMLPQMAVQLLASAMPENERLKLLQEQLTLTHPAGIIVYIIIVYILTLGFSFVFINPKDYSDRLLKSGDSLVNIHAGRETARYLSKSLRNICIFSATVMSFCVGIPLYLQVKGSVDNTLMTMPSAVMMLTGVCCNLCREYRAVKSFDSYRPFI